MMSPVATERGASLLLCNLSSSRQLARNSFLPRPRSTVENFALVARRFVTASKLYSSEMLII